MKILLKLLFCLMLILFISNYTAAQKTRTIYREIESRKLKTPKPLQKIKEANQFDSISDEAGYYAPIRYVIVYNEILTSLNERRIEILIDEKSHSEEILATVFTHIAKKFPSPIRLTVKAHTNLATIETPEERQMLRDGEDTRFKDVRSHYKSSSFGRMENGRESFVYQLSTNPENYEVIVLTEGNQNK